MDECEPLAGAVNRGLEKRLDGTYVIPYGEAVQVDPGLTRLDPA